MKTGSSTPWGPAQTVIEIGDDIFIVSTASHGGMHLPEKLNKQIPQYFRNDQGWYEEDCAIAIPGFVLGASVFTTEQSAEFISSGDAERTVKQWYPDEWERYTGKTLQPGESSTRDQAVYLKKHKEDWLTVAAFGSWHKQVPEGYVGVCATIGCSRSPHAMARYFIIPETEYEQREFLNPFVVNPNRHQEVPNFA
jgi:hypothetical protein